MMVICLNADFFFLKHDIMHYKITAPAPNTGQVNSAGFKVFQMNQRFVFGAERL